MSFDDKDEAEIVYAIRYTPRAVLDVEKEHARLAALVDDSTADAWEQGLLDAVARLATMPTIHAVISEQRLFQNIRVHELLYRRLKSSAQYRILFVVRKNTMDAPFVRILHVRHGARRPLTRAEAIQIKSEDY